MQTRTFECLTPGPGILAQFECFLQAVQRIETLYALLKRGTNPTDTYKDAFAEAQLILDALPLNTDEFALAGTGLGTWVAMAYGSSIFEVTANSIQPQAALLWYALLVTPAFAAAASLIPAALAVVQDPTYVLRGQ